MTGNDRATVSLAMIVRNEGRHLADCLTPVSALFDEIVIVDTGSHDETKHIAGQFTPRVFDFPWCDDFSAARNEALRHCRGEWVMWLDADDRVSPENVARLGALLKRLDHEPGAYLMDTVCTSKYACESAKLITHLRLFRRQDGLRWHGRVHEQLRLDVKGSKPIEAIWSDVQIRHIGYEDPTVQQRKRQRDVRLLRMDYAVDPDNRSTLIHLGLAYFHLGRWDQSRECLGRLLAMNDAPGDYMRQVYTVLATIDMREGKLGEALALLDRALAVFPAAEYLLYLRAECLHDLDRYAEARQTLLFLINGVTEPQYHGGVPCDVKDKLAPRKLAEVLLLEHEYSAAESLLESVLARFPEDTLSWHALGRVYLDLRERAKLMAAAERLRSCPQGEIFAATLLAAWHMMHGELELAGPLIDQLISEAPQMPLPRMLRADWLARVQAPIADRIHACRDVLRLLPGNPDAKRMLSHLEATQRKAELSKVYHQVAAQQSPQRPSASFSPGDSCISLVIGVGMPGGTA